MNIFLHHFIVMKVDKKKDRKTIIWIIIIIILGILMLWGLYDQFKTDRDFQKHKEKEENQSL